MTLICFYNESSGKITKLVKGAHDPNMPNRVRNGEGARGIVMKCPKEVFHMSPRQIRRDYRVCNESNGFVELEYAGE
jgi:hypothetical protein